VKAAELFLLVILVAAGSRVTIADVMIEVDTRQELELTIAVITMNPERHRFGGFSSCLLALTQPPYTFEIFPRESIPCACLPEYGAASCYEVLIKVGGKIQ
jgi:hypothetical protein